MENNIIIYIFGHEYWLMFYGIMLFHLTRWNKAKNKLDKEHKKFNSRRWWIEEKDDIIRSLAFAPAIIIFDDELLAIYNDYMKTTFTEFSKYMYFVAGLTIDRLIVFFNRK